MLPNLHPYQHRAVDFIERNPAAFLILDMGLGKTVSTLTAIDRLLTCFLISRVLVIAPKRVTEQTWPEELTKWPHLRGLSYAIASGSAAQRRGAIESGADVTLIGRDNVSWLVTNFCDHWPFDMIVVDESGSFKSPSSERFKALKKVRKHIDRIVLLTGTPASRSLADLWSQAWLLDGGERLGRSYYHFRHTYFQQTDWHGYTWEPRDGAQQQIMGQLSDISMSMSASDYLSLPERSYLYHRVALSDTERAQYDEMSRHSVIEIAADGVITAANAAVLVGKLLQIASGAVYSEGGDGALELHRVKLDALQELVDASQSEPLLVAYQYRHERERIKQLYPNAVDVTEAGAVERWNRREIPMLLCHPQSAGHGLNLQRGGRRVVWYGLTWSLELYQQLNARLHRQGQTEPVFVHHLVVAGTIEEQVLEVLAQRATVQEAVIKAIKA